MKSSTVYAASLCKFVRFETMILPSIRFDIINWAYRTLKSLWIYFLTVNRKKTFRKIFSYKLGCRTKTLSDFCKCFTELYFFYWLFMLVVSRAILIAVLFVFNRSWTSLAEYSKSAPTFTFMFMFTWFCIISLVGYPWDYAMGLENQEFIPITCAWQ